MKKSALLPALSLSLPLTRCLVQQRVLFSSKLIPRGQVDITSALLSQLPPSPPHELAHSPAVGARTEIYTEWGGQEDEGSVSAVGGGRGGARGGLGGGFWRETSSSCPYERAALDLAMGIVGCGLAARTLPTAKLIYSSGGAARSDDDGARVWVFFFFCAEVFFRAFSFLLSLFISVPKLMFVLAFLIIVNFYYYEEREERALSDANS